MWGGIQLGGGSGQGGKGVCVRRIEKMQKKSWGGEGVPIGSKVGGSG